MPSIFDNEDNKVKSNWFQKKKVGDKIEGTLVSKRVVMNQLSGKEQNVYELKLANGEFWNVGGSIGIDAQIRNVKLGQIVGFEFVEERAAKKPGLNPTKVVKVWANPKLVDEEWLKQQNEEMPSFDDDGEEKIPVEEAFADSLEKTKDSSLSGKKTK